MKDTSKFPRVGDNVLAYVGNGCAHPDPRYTTMVAKGTMGRGSSPIGSVGHKTNVQINETMGARFCVKATLYKANAAEASATERNVKILPPAMGRSDFWNSKRSFKQGV